MKAKLLATLADISNDRPNEWWEGERNKPKKGATLNY
jgi:hypothetical protein